MSLHYVLPTHVTTEFHEWPLRSTCVALSHSTPIPSRFQSSFTISKMKITINQNLGSQMYIMNIQQMHGTSLEYAHITSYSPSKHPIIARDSLKDKGATPETWHHAIRIVANLSWVFCFCFCFFFQWHLQIALCILWPNQHSHHHLLHQRSQTLQSEFIAISFFFFHAFKSQAISSSSLTWCCQKNTLNKSAIASHSIEFRVRPEENFLHACANQHWFGLLRRRCWVGIDAWSFHFICV